jgi:transcription elongation factor Elf1
MVMRMKRTRYYPKYYLEKGRCAFCGHVTEVELYYNYEYKKYKYACKECGESLEKGWVKASAWDYSEQEEEEWEDEWGW